LSLERNDDILADISDEVRLFCSHLSAVFTAPGYSKYLLQQLYRPSYTHQLILAEHDGSEVMMRLPMGWTSYHLLALLRNVIRPAFSLWFDLSDKLPSAVEVLGAFDPYM
jgi:hypothetical protein